LKFLLSFFSKKQAICHTKFRFYFSCSSQCANSSLEKLICTNCFSCYIKIIRWVILVINRNFFFQFCIMKHLINLDFLKTTSLVKMVNNLLSQIGQHITNNRPHYLLTMLDMKTKPIRNISLYINQTLLSFSPLSLCSILQSRSQLA